MKATEKQLQFIEKLEYERGLTVEDLGFDREMLDDEEKGATIASGIIKILLDLPKLINQ